MALSGVDSVALFDPHSLERLATLAVGENPHEIAAAPDSRLLYVANARDSSITVLEAAPRPRVIAIWRLPDQISVHDVAIGSDGMIWAAAGQPATLFGMDPPSGTVRHHYRLQMAGAPTSRTLPARSP